MLEIREVGCSFGALRALDDVSITIPTGKIIGLVGPNGAGKTSLLNCISGINQAYSGTIQFKGINLTGMAAWKRARLGIGRTFQTPRLLERESVKTNVGLGTESLGHESFVETLFNLPRNRNNRRRDVGRVNEVLEVLGLYDVADQVVGELPFARRRVVELGRALTGRVGVVLLDEPAAGLEAAERKHLQDVLRSLNRMYKMTMVLVEHDVEFLNAVSEVAVAMNFGRVIAAGSIQEVLTHKEVREAYFGTHKGKL